MANGKLTLRLDDRLIDQAKDLAARRGVSVDRLIGEILEAISGANGSPASGETHWAASQIASKTKDKTSGTTEVQHQWERAIIERMRD